MTEYVSQIWKYNGYILSEQEAGEDCIRPAKMLKGTGKDEGGLVSAAPPGSLSGRHLGGCALPAGALP